MWPQALRQPSHTGIHTPICFAEVTSCLGVPTNDGKTALGESSPAKPTLHVLVPLSITRATTSSSPIIRKKTWTYLNKLIDIVEEIRSKPFCECYIPCIMSVIVCRFWSRLLLVIRILSKFIRILFKKASCSLSSGRPFSVDWYVIFDSFIVSESPSHWRMR